MKNTDPTFSIRGFANATGMQQTTVRKILDSLEDGCDFTTIAAALYNAQTKQGDTPAAKTTGFSINNLSKLTGLDRATITRRLEDVEATKGAKSARLYELGDALPILINGEFPDLEDLRRRKLEAETIQAETKVKEQAGELLPKGRVLDHYVKLFAAMYNRIAKRFPTQIAAQAYKAESPAQIAELLSRELDRIFNEIQSDHPSIL